MSTTPSSIAAALVTLIEGVSDTGLAYDHLPLLKPEDDPAKFVEAFTTTIAGDRVVRAWTVSWLGISPVERRRGVGSTKMLRDHRFLIRAHYGMGGDSEVAFRDGVAAVADAIDADVGLSGLILEHAGVEVAIPNNGDGYSFQGVLVHYAELSLTCRVEETL